MRVRVRRHYHSFPGDKLVKCWRCGLNLLESEAIVEAGRYFHTYHFDETEPGEMQGRSTGIDSQGTGVGLTSLTYTTTFGQLDVFFTHVDGLDFFNRR